MGLLLQIRECLKCKAEIGMDILNIRLLIYLHHGEKCVSNSSIVSFEFLC